MNTMGSSIIEVISEDYFNEKTKNLNFIEKYVGPYSALVIKGDDNLYYINQRGKCFIIPDIYTVDSFLEQSIVAPKPESYYSFIKSLGNTKIDSIQNIIEQFTQSNRLAFKDIDQETVYKVDKVVTKMADRTEAAVIVYFIVGEYFRWAFSNGYSWSIQFDAELNLNLPVLIENAIGKQIRFDEEVFEALNDKRVETPVKFSVNAIFYKL